MTSARLTEKTISTGKRHKIRVLQIVQNLNYGGMERIIAEMTRRIDRSRFDTHILALGFLGHFSDQLERFATLHTARPLSRLSLLHPASLAEDIRAIAPDVVHTHSGVWYKAGLASKMAGVPFQVHTDHGRENPDPWSDKFIDRMASRRSHVVVAVSNLLGTQLRAIVHRPDTVRVIPNGVNVDEFHPADDDGVIRQELGIDPERPIIGSIGRLVPIKGYDIMVEAFTRLLRTWEHGPPPALVLIGDGTQRDALERAASAAECRNAVHFLGWRSDVLAYHRAFTVFTMSSRSEGTSVSLLEAMSAGICPVVTDVGGNAAVLGPDLAHRLVPSEAPDALANAWREALLQHDRRRHDANAARARVQSAFSLDAMVRSYESVYTEAKQAR